MKIYISRSSFAVYHPKMRRLALQSRNTSLHSLPGVRKATADCDFAGKTRLRHLDCRAGYFATHNVLNTQQQVSLPA